MQRFLYIIFLTACCLFLLSAKNNGNKEWIVTGHAQGTTYRILYVAPTKIIQQQDIDDLLDQLDSSISIYKPYSTISLFNKNEKGVPIDSHFRTVVKTSFEIYRNTQALSDITVKPLMDAWGFGVHQSNNIPDEKSISQLLDRVGQNKLLLKGDSLIKTNPLTQIDVNGIGQGYAVDLIAGLIEKKGIANYLVELGGELRIKGKKSSGKRFKVGIGAVTDDETMQLIVSPENGAITTSGNYINFRMNDNKKISHIINPQNGRPIDNEMISVTVWAKDALTADGYDNGFLAMGLKSTLKFLKNRKDIGAYIIYQKSDGTVADTSSLYFWKHVKKAN